MTHLLSPQGLIWDECSEHKKVAGVPPPTRIRRISIRSFHRASRSQPPTLPTSTLDPACFDINRDSTLSSNRHSRAKPYPIYDQLVVALISLSLPPPPGHY